MSTAYLNRGYYGNRDRKPSFLRKKYRTRFRRLGYSAKTRQVLKRLKPEHKGVSYSLSWSFFSNSVVLPHSNLVTFNMTEGTTAIKQGSGFSERIGNKIQIDRVYVRCIFSQFLNWNAGVNQSAVRIIPGYAHVMLILDTQPTGTAPVESDLFALPSTGSTGDLGMQFPDLTKTRLKVLRHEKVSLDGITGEVEHIDINYIPKKPIIVHWQDTGSVPTQNGLYLWLFWSSGHSAATTDTFSYPSYAYKVRVRYYDI